jgi:hypothetical protein
MNPIDLNITIQANVSGKIVFPVALSILIGTLNRKSTAGYMNNYLYSMFPKLVAMLLNTLYTLIVKKQLSASSIPNGISKTYSSAELGPRKHSPLLISNVSSPTLNVCSKSVIKLGVKEHKILDTTRYGNSLWTPAYPKAN